MLAGFSYSDTKRKIKNLGILTNIKDDDPVKYKDIIEILDKGRQTVSELIDKIILTFQIPLIFHEKFYNYYFTIAYTIRQFV